MKKDAVKRDNKKNETVTNILDHKREKTIKRIVDRAKNSGHVQEER